MLQQPKGRPVTSPVELKEGFYLEIKTNGSNSSVKIRRDSTAEIELAIGQYENSKIVTYLGQVKAGKWLDGKNKGTKAVLPKIGGNTYS